MILFSIYIIIFLFGLIIGSFLNVVILRFNTGQKIGNDRSKCMSCSHVLGFRDLFPLISWLSTLGRCRYCKTRISPQYPIVEFSTGLLFVLGFYHLINIMLISNINFIIEFIYLMIIFSILMIIFVYDLRHKIIPNLFSYSFAIITFIHYLYFSYFVQGLDLLAFPEILNLFSGLIFFIPFFLLWFISRGQWMGLGDGKLVLGVGWFLGFTLGLSGIILSFWLGAIFALIIMFISKLNRGDQSITMKTEIPFGPFIILGTLIVYFFQIDILGLSLLF